jgi:hypothetical protein
MPSVGQQFDFDRFPQAMRGGMRVYPYGGIVSGLAVGTVTYNATTDVLTIPYAAGVVRLDGKKYSVGSSTITVSAVASGATVVTPLYILPTRANPVVTSAMASGADAPPTGGTGNLRLHAVDMGEYFKLVDFYKYSGSAWAKHDIIFDPPTLDYGNLPHNQITAATVSVTPEKMVYGKDVSSPFLSMPAAHYVRYDCSFLYAVVTSVTAGSGDVVTATVEYKEVEIVI